MSKKYWLGMAILATTACQQPPVIIGGRDASMPARDASTRDAGQPTPRAKPEVTLLIDSSGSMNRLPNCLCTTLGCTECLPDCTAGQQNRWHIILGAVTGSFQHFSCTESQRTASNGSTYDVGYAIPFYPLASDAQQRADGILDRYADRINFGVATFDGLATYVGASDLVPLTTFDATLSNGVPGEYSFAGKDANGPRVRPDGSVVGKLFYPTVTQPYMIDTGILNASAPVGALMLPSASTASATMNAALKADLLRVRPFGGSPVAAALDDLYFAYQQSNSTSPKRYVLLVTDGYYDDDFRNFPSPGCNCPKDGNCPATEDPTQMSCPYPTAQDAALHLRCGFDAATCAGVVAKVFAVSVSDTDVARSGVDAIAANGGTTALYVEPQTDLAATLDAALSALLADAGQ